MDGEIKGKMKDDSWNLEWVTECMEMSFNGNKEDWM